jgi:lysozyme
MRINDEGLELIKQFEGLRLRAYKDAVGVTTIGFGHTRTAKDGMVITEQQAEDLLREDLKDAEQGVTRVVKVPLGSNEFSALVSFVFNLGIGNLSKSTLLKKLNAGDRVGASGEFLKWNKAGGRVLNGLTRRREAERRLFLS